MSYNIPFGNTTVINTFNDFPDLQDPSRFRFKSRDLSAIDTIVIHHTVGPEPAKDSEGQMAQIRQIYNQWSRPGNKYNTQGFPYHFMLYEEAFYYVGSMFTSRACVEKENDHIVCVALPGNYDEEMPPEPFRVRITEFTDNLRYVLGRKENGLRVPIVGHQDMMLTHCPGLTWSLWKHELEPEG